jgi:hypothetical protein
VLWNGSSRPTTYISDTELEAAISASDLASPGTVLVRATTPGAPPSNALTFTISDLSFKLTSLSPWTASPGGPGFALTVNGSGFTADSIVQWNGANRPTTYHSAEELTASIPASDIPAPGAARVTVAGLVCRHAGVTYSFMVSAYYGDGGNLAFSLTYDSPMVSLSPPDLDFGAQPLNVTTSAQDVTVTNTGTVALHISGITIAGGNSADFAQTNTCNAGSYAPAASCTVSVTFKPTAGGPRNAQLRITDDALGSPQAVTLTGGGAGASVSPASLIFGSQPVGSSSSPLAVTLTNLGATPIHVWGTAIVGTNSGDFSRVNSCPVPPATLGGGAYCTISVQFTPAGIGTRKASLMISHDGGASPSSVPLSGTGTAALSSSAPLSGSSHAATPRAAERLRLGRANR